jgi:hypothetical protein
MKPVKQTKFGKSGNCLWACVASLLEIDISDLPDTKYLDCDDEESWFASFYKLQDWLIANHRIFILSIAPSEYINRFLKDTYIMGMGISKSSGCNHSVILKNGIIEHDPKGAYDIDKIIEYDLLVKCFK